MARVDALLQLHKVLIARRTDLRAKLLGDLDSLHFSDGRDSADEAFDAGNEEVKILKEAQDRQVSDHADGDEELSPTLLRLCVERGKSAQVTQRHSHGAKEDRKIAQPVREQTDYACKISDKQPLIEVRIRNVRP